MNERMNKGKEVGLLAYLPVTRGRMKNIHMWPPKTSKNWNTIFPRIYFRKYSARSTTMKANCRSSIMRNGMGTLLSTRYVKTPPSSTSGCKSTAVLQTPSD
jgi:hypothetical protein